ncbi:MAG: DUF2064 domain-containing protein [Gammaproteobacteria bacterium]|nr:DUF2064 domain-containing protein [Gammaproteobacteria bacterium]
MRPEPSLSPTLALFCRRPRVGHGKRRLAAEIGDEAAADIADGLLEAALADAAVWPGAVVIAPADAADSDWAGHLLPRTCAVCPQPPGTLGQRIATVDRELRQQGHHRLVFIGSDAPSLTADDYDLAITQLEAGDVVLGPAADGGVTLMGASTPWPELQALPWETAALGDALRAACERSSLRVFQLPTRFDVDRLVDLHRLRHELANDSRPSRQALLNRVTRWLQ